MSGVGEQRPGRDSSAEFVDQARELFGALVGRLFTAAPELREWLGEATSGLGALGFGAGGAGGADGAGGAGGAGGPDPAGGGPAGAPRIQRVRWDDWDSADVADDAPDAHRIDTEGGR